jgi:hypothetical protein
MSLMRHHSMLGFGGGQVSRAYTSELTCHLIVIVLYRGYRV